MQNAINTIENYEIHDVLRTGSGCEWQRSKQQVGGTDESNVLLGVPVIIPEHADGLSESREIEDTAEVELNGCQSGTGVHRRGAG